MSPSLAEVDVLAPWGNAGQRVRASAPSRAGLQDAGFAEMPYRGAPEAARSLLCETGMDRLPSTARVEEMGDELTGTVRIQEECLQLEVTDLRELKRAPALGGPGERPVLPPALSGRGARGPLPPLRGPRRRARPNAPRHARVANRTAHRQSCAPAVHRDFTAYVRPLVCPPRHSSKLCRGGFADRGTTLAHHTRRPLRPPAPRETKSRRGRTEREGFEPSVGVLPLHTLSRRAPSTTRSPLPSSAGPDSTSLAGPPPRPRRFSHPAPIVAPVTALLQALPRRLRRPRHAARLSHATPSPIRPTPRRDEVSAWQQSRSA